MDKTTYYVSLHTGIVFTDPTYESYEYIIEATDQEANELRELFENAHEMDGYTFVRSHLPVLQYHEDKANHDFDESFKAILNKIHRLGNDVSRKHIESMGILDHTD